MFKGAGGVYLYRTRLQSGHGLLTLGQPTHAVPVALSSWIVCSTVYLVSTVVLSAFVLLWSSSSYFVAVEDVADGWAKNCHVGWYGASYNAVACVRSFLLWYSVGGVVARCCQI